MTKRYCLDTSALSTPLEHSPISVHRRFWENVIAYLGQAEFAMTPEVHEEAANIDGPVGNAIKRVEQLVVFQIGEVHWNSKAFAATVDQCRNTYRSFIHEYNGLQKHQTVGMTDVGIICLAKTLNVPLVSSESPVGGVSIKKMKIPDLCKRLSVVHMTFYEFVRAESLGDE